ncbi:cysteine-rich CWC family protein [Bacillus sp. JJ664]
MAIKICPMCGNENKCSSGKTCWCNDEYFPREIFNQISPEEVRRSCICKSCLDKYKKDKGIEDLKPSDIGPMVFGRKNEPKQDDEVCYCYEKFKDKLKPGTVTKCFKEKCATYLRCIEERNNNRRC